MDGATIFVCVLIPTLLLRQTQVGVADVGLPAELRPLQVIGGSVRVVLGGTAVLPCKLIDTAEPLHQISWQRKTREKVQTDNFYTIQTSGPVFVNGNDRRFQFIGSFKDNNGTLQLTNVLLKDEGVYTCIFTVFPSGNHKTEIPLTIFVLPSVSVKDEYPLEGKEERLLATCTAAGSRPPAEVSWITGSLGDKVRATRSSTQNGNDTTTTISSLLGVPTKEINRQKVRCVVKSEAPEISQDFTIQIYFPPVEAKIVERDQDTFECLTEANPDANVTWSRSDGPLPQSAEADGGKLKLQSISSDLNGLYQCEASNQYGKKHSQLYVHVPSGSCTVCWVIFGLALIASCVVAAVVYYFKFLRNEESPQRVPTSEPEEAPGEADTNI
ncbi:nectin-1 isoform X2 [Parambassis ranga]|uniref:Nectin-1 isoform X2 n=1 Tax=Parambassis ranga TaxID=210632 RepID=A0A6P7H2H2_9TELE|nr:nectin-1-like isoform X2 [Parambassis ranga]